MKTCSKCKQTKPLSEFYKNKYMADGYKSQCKACEYEYEKTRDQNKKRAYAKKYREAHKAEERARFQKWKIENPEKYAAYHKASKVSKRLKVDGPKDSGITVQALYDRDGGVCKLCGLPCDFSDYTYVGETFVAGNFYPSIDHIRPLAKGGTHTWGNVQLAHRVCNSYKHTKTGG